MSNRTIILIVVVLVAALAGLFFYLYDQSGPKFDWNETSWNKKAYSEKSDQPYGTEVAHRLLEQYFPDKSLTDLTKNVGEELPTDSSQHYNYVFIGEALYLDSMSTRLLLEFVGRGNTAFFSSKTMPFDLMNYIYYQECEDGAWNEYGSFEDTLAHLSLPEPKPGVAGTFQFARQNRRQLYSWHYIESQFFCEELPQRPLGYLNDSLINFAEFPYRKGKFLLHTNPIVFSNYSLSHSESKPYVQALLSWLPEGNIYWDAVSRIPEQVGRKRNRGGSREANDEHPLSYILQQPALAWAWYLLVGLAGVWLLFRAKRRQRIIPILPKNENSSYEFIATIANLHFRDRNYRGLCVQSMKLFLAQVRERYNLVAPVSPETGLPRVDDAYFQRLATVSEVPEIQIRDIFTQYGHTMNYEPTEDMMVDLHLAMEAFFKKAK